MSGLSPPTTRRPAGRSGPGAAPLARLAARLAALTPEDPLRYAPVPVAVSGPDSNPGAGSAVGRGPELGAAAGGAAPAWLAPAEVVPAMLAAGGQHLTISPAVAGARLAGSLGFAAAGRLGVALAVARQAYDTGPDSLLVALGDDGLVTGIGVRRGTVAVLPTDTSDPVGLRAKGTDVVLDLEDLARWAAAGAWATLAGWLEQVHQATGFGRVPSWNLLADSVLGPATAAAELAGLDPRVGRVAGEALVDALIEQGAPIRRRGRLEQRVEAGRLVLTTVRGACCLYFRQGGELCAGCPLGERRC